MSVYIFFVYYLPYLGTRVVPTATAAKRLLSTLRGEKPFLEKTPHVACARWSSWSKRKDGRLSWSKPSWVAFTRWPSGNVGVYCDKRPGECEVKGARFKRTTCRARVGFSRHDALQVRHPHLGVEYLALMGHNPLFPRSVGCRESTLPDSPCWF